jgi:hypothetical protein
LKTIFGDCERLSKKSSKPEGLLFRTYFAARDDDKSDHGAHGLVFNAANQLESRFGNVKVIRQVESRFGNVRIIRRLESRACLKRWLPSKRAQYSTDSVAYSYVHTFSTHHNYW